MIYVAVTYQAKWKKIARGMAGIMDGHGLRNVRAYKGDPDIVQADLIVFPEDDIAVGDEGGVTRGGSVSVGYSFFLDDFDGGCDRRIVDITGPRITYWGLDSRDGTCHFHAETDVDALRIAYERAAGACSGIQAYLDELGTRAADDKWLIRVDQIEWDELDASTSSSDAE